MQPTNSRILTINGGSSSIKFALSEAGEPLRRILAWLEWQAMCSFLTTQQMSTFGDQKNAFVSLALRIPVTLSMYCR
jgi:acetate kinase